MVGPTLFLWILGKEAQIMEKYTFSGHESFQCKNLWLKKGYDYVKQGHSFTSDDAVVELGVGKNMVASIKYWLKSFSVIDNEDKPTDLGKFIFSDDGADPFLEDISTIWLLHYTLVRTRHASLYSLLFSSFHKTRNEFTKEQLMSFLKQENYKERFKGFIFNENTVSKDIDTFLKNYVEPSNKSNYEDFSTLLLPLNLIRKVDRDNYVFNYSSRANLNPLVFLYAVKDKTNNAKAVDFDVVLELARIFCLSTNDLYAIFEQLHHISENISFENTAGEQLLTINDELDKMAVLRQLYF